MFICGDWLSYGMENKNVEHKTNINFKYYSKLEHNRNSTRITPSVKACHFDSVVSEEITMPEVLNVGEIM